MSAGAVDIWHCDALGEYFGYGEVAATPDHAEPTNTLTFLRGTQVTDDDGRCAFTTIVPGWYTGRAVHIHVKDHPTPDTQARTATSDHGARHGGEILAVTA
jgi:protocatechuate 3,4-dioxygenase beta subunit